MKKRYKFLIELGIIAVSVGLAYVSHLIFLATGLSDSVAPPVIIFIIALTVFNGVASKFVKDSAFFHFFYYPDWEKKSKVLVIFLVALFAAATVLAVFRPSQEKMIDMASDEVRAEIAADEARTQKRVITTYQSLYCINYVSFQSTTGSFNEKYVGFCGTIIPANDGPAATTGSFVNYTYRMLGCRQSFLFGIKLTVVLTAAAVTTGLFLAVFLALGKISKLKVLSKICSGYIFFFRGTPLLIQLFVVYLAIPNMIPGFSWRLAALKIMPSVGNEAVYYG
ncbi:MAG: ABC transporter permease subunit, partial [Clostridia bacterium]|nr:ABC transporter permease subunit [Clostridia bacterium]